MSNTEHNPYAPPAAVIEDERLPGDDGNFIPGGQRVPAGNCPVRIAIVTARSSPAHARVVHTLRNWNVNVDEAFFLGGVSKHEVLAAFGAHIFFDDQTVHLDSAAPLVPSGHVPWRQN